MVLAHNLLDAYETPQLVEALTEQLQGRPVVGVYHGDEPNAVLVRICVTDVGFLHGLRDQLLLGSFGPQLMASLEFCVTRFDATAYYETNTQRHGTECARVSGGLLEITFLR